MPTPRLKGGIVFILALALPTFGAMLLLPLLDHYPIAGILVLIGACFWSFYYSAKGGSPVLGAFLTIGLALLTAVGSDSIDALLMSTVIGGIGAIIMWQLLSIWPSLVLYTLLVALAGLIMGKRVFSGLAMHPQAATWSYAFLTMIVLIAPAVTDGPGSNSAAASFYSRLSMMFVATVYSVLAVRVYDAFRPLKMQVAAHAESSA